MAKDPSIPSNAIGNFIIGVDPIGTLPDFNWPDTIISQYANSPVLIALIESFFEAMDQTRNLDEFFDKMWNIDTAEGYGLDAWGRKVGVGRVLTISAGEYFGFETGGGDTSFQPFNSAPFFTGNPFVNNFSLLDPAYRQLILAKALSNICDGSIPAINQLLLFLFPGRGNCYVADNNDMTMTYTFNFQLSPVEQAILAQSGVFPRSTGVAVNIAIIPPT